MLAPIILFAWQQALTNLRLARERPVCQLQTTPASQTWQQLINQTWSRLFRPRLKLARKFYPHLTRRFLLFPLFGQSRLFKQIRDLPGTVPPGPTRQIQHLPGTIPLGTGPKQPPLPGAVPLGTGPKQPPLPGAVPPGLGPKQPPTGPGRRNPVRPTPEPSPVRVR